MEFDLRIPKFLWNSLNPNPLINLAIERGIFFIKKFII